MSLATRLFGVALLFLIGATAHAYSTSQYGFAVTVEPILAYEYTQRNTPTVHRGGMFVYGARFTAGKPHIAAEGEYTRGSDTEAFVNPTPQNVTTTRENVRLGVRGTYDLGAQLGAFLRFGGQASKASEVSVNQSGVSTANDPKWLIKPYAGTGLNIALAKVFSLGLDASYVFNSLDDFSQNTIQFGGSIRFNLNAK